MKLHEVLEDLSSRFLVNLPAEEFESFERLFFNVEEAHWFYQDFYREVDSTLPNISLKVFSSKIFPITPALKPYTKHLDQLFAEWNQYKFTISTYGAILLTPNLSKCLMVRGWNSKTWTFPKGKVNKNEAETDAAIREVKEEIGFDIGPYIQPNEYIETMHRQQKQRLYIIEGIPESTNFAPQTRKEISAISWIPISQLPTYNEKSVAAKKFYLVLPYTNRLKSWIKVRKRKGKKQQINNSNNNTSNNNNNNSGQQILQILKRGNPLPLPPSSSSTSITSNTSNNSYASGDINQLLQALQSGGNKGHNSKNNISAHNSGKSISIDDLFGSTSNLPQSLPIPPLADEEIIADNDSDNSDTSNQHPWLSFQFDTASILNEI